MAGKNVELIKRLRERVRGNLGDVEISDHWDAARMEYARCILEEDVLDFLNWTISSGKLNFQPSEPTISFLRKQPDWNEWKKALVRSPVGNPPVYEYCPEGCGNLVTQASHLATVLVETESELKDFDAVFEFGGGFGCMCRLLYNRGFEGKYISMDLPELCALQEYYLSSTIPEKKISYGKYSDLSDIILLTDKKIFNKLIEKEKGKGLFLALYSLSESPFSLRNSILRTVLRSIDCILIAFQHEWYGYNNDIYFRDLAEGNQNYRWKMCTVLSSDYKCMYLMGKRSNDDYIR